MKVKNIKGIIGFLSYFIINMFCLSTVKAVEVEKSQFIFYVRILIQNSQRYENPYNTFETNIKLQI